MSTSAPSNIFAQDTNAHFQAWYNEIITALFTTLGVTQTSDTGQIGATAAIPAINTSAGYVIGRFNDTLQSTAPIFFKLEFGAGAAVSDPQMWLTVGTSSNGSGTIGNGGGAAVSTRVAILGGNAAPISLSTAYTSRYCYLATTQCGILWMAFKYGSTGGTTPTNQAAGCFVIARTSDTSGNASANGIVILTTAASATNPGTNVGNGVEQVLSFASAAAIPAAPANGWVPLSTTANFILGLTTTLEGTTAFVAPIYTVDPVIRYSAYVGMALITDFAVGSTSSFAIVGSTPMTFISAGSPFAVAAAGFDGSSLVTRTLVLPWQ